MATHRIGFWRQAIAINQSITPHVIPLVLTFGVISLGISLLAWAVERFWQFHLAMAVAPYEIAGAVLGLLLVLRTNAGYDRWWEARKLWGGIVNQSRNLAISGLAYGPENASWRKQFIHWVAAFPYVARNSLRGESLSPEVVELIGEERASHVKHAPHMPSFVALRLGCLLRNATEEFEMDRFAFLQLDRERALLIEHIGACERILKTPLPMVYSIKIRRFIVLFLITLPLALLDRVDNIWVIPLVTMMVAYPLVSLDQIGIELEDPFSSARLSHLPLSDIALTIERNVVGLARDYSLQPHQVLHTKE